MGIQWDRRDSNPSHKAITVQLMHLFSYMTQVVRIHLSASLTACWEIQEYASSEVLSVLVGEHCLMLSVEVVMGVVVKIVVVCVVTHVVFCVESELHEGKPVTSS
jgi:hypothetical protein